MMRVFVSFVQEVDYFVANGLVFPEHQTLLFIASIL
jgi:hypothetical protein